MEREGPEAASIDFFQARYMSAGQGRFTSADPLGNFVANATDPQSWNMYSYARNNPLAFVDPSGLDYCDYGQGYIDADPAFGGASQQECADAGGSWQYSVAFTDTVDQNNSGQETYYEDSGNLDGSQLDGGFNLSATGTGTGLPQVTGSGQRGCVSLSNGSQAVLAKGLSYLARRFHKTFGVGAGGSVGAGAKGLGFAFGYSSQVVASPDGSLGVETSITPLQYAPLTKGVSAIFGLQGSVSNATTVGALAGVSYDGGASFGDWLAAGLDLSYAQPTWQTTATLGIGFGGRSQALTQVRTFVNQVCQ